MTKIKYSVLAEVEWHFDGEDIDWQFLNENATFSHRDACEFVLHIGHIENPNSKDESYWEFMETTMKKFGCSEKFIQGYLDAKDAGAVRVLFWS